MDPFSIVADEVALEGLDGITIPSLWIRLEDRKPKFPLKLDDCTKELIWKSLISNTDLKIYQLPKERQDIELFDRYKDIDPETGIETAQTFSDTRKDIYPVHIVENKDGIQGSCALFKERTDITEHVRSKTPLLTLQAALERYGRKLVVVASQVLRFRTLIGFESDPDLKLNDDSYCVLERVGRARWQGELQRDLHGCSFKIDARKLHYMRKALVRHGLLSMQSYVTRLKSGSQAGQQQHSILLLLKRFHINRRTKYDILMEYVSNFLQQSPGQFSTMLTLKDLLNVDEGTFKRVFQYMRSAKLVEYCQFPLEDLDPGAGPCTNKKGNKVLVRCLRLLKPYTGKGVAEDDDDEDEDEDDDGAARRRALPSEGQIMESDVLTQAYHIVISCGPKGIPQRGIGSRMNVGKLESRMICRRLEREGLIKGFMEDEGRQRTTKFISHKCFGVSDKLQQFAKEQERQKLLYSSAPQTSDAAPPTPTTPSMSKAKENSKTPAAKKVKKTVGGRNKDAEEAKQTCGDGEEDTAAEGLVGKEGEVGGNGTSAGEKSSVETNRTQPDIPIVQLTPAESDTPACSNSTTSVTLDSVSPTPTAEQARVEDEESNSSTASTLLQSELLNADDNPVENNIVLVKDVCKPRAPPCKTKYQRAFERSHETYRLLRRKNLIVEAVRSFKVIEGLFPLQKIINDDEKQDGSSSKCCRKTILRLVDSLSREGLLKVYKTTVIQDGITKNIEMVVHPSVQPKDDIVSRVIEQVRFRISSSYAAVRLQLAEEKVREQGTGSDETNGSPSKAQKGEKKKKKEEFQPTRVRGLGKTFGFQPKMHRLRLVHNFLWYLIYGHPLRHNFSDSHSTGLTPADQNRFDPDAKHPDSQEKQDLKDSVDPLAADCNLDVASSGDEEEALKDVSTPSCSQSGLKVYADEESWKKFMPPVRVHKEFGSGWARVGDLLLCLPLSIFIQVIQINYKVDGLEDYLNDPVKQHHLIRVLPARMRRQLLFKRKYIFAFHENLQKLVYMGLLQFGPVEKFKEKDQVFLYLRRNATIVDTTSAEPHYWLVTESQDKPFEKRQYAFNTAEDVENYWFDLMCVCLNTPLGVIRNKRSATDEENAPSFVHERNVFVGLAYLLKGSREACDDGSIPGDGKGAGGLDSEFFAHLKRNWLWTNHLLAVRTIPSGLEAKENKIRLKSLLSKNALRIALKAGGSTAPRYVTAKRPLIETVEMDIEPASRNQQVVGGKRQKRKRSKKEVVKAPRKKKKEPKKRLPAHDEADHRALKRMTRQRVYWSVQEDSLMMLCSVASQLLNSKLKRAFIPYCLVRDLLQAEFEISMDKTSLAVGRRTRYILKNPQTLLNYRICLAEVYQDKPLMRLLEAKQPADPDNPEDCGKAFSEYARLLRQKFSAVFLSARDMIMPDTKHQLFSRFKVSTIEDGRRVAWKDDLNCTDDIHSIVLHNLIQSTLAMTNIQMKSSRSFQTFHMYSKYNQELLCQVFVQCRKRGLVNRRRVNQPFGPKKNRALPILPMSYQLSQSYYRCFSWRFPHSLCTDSFRFLRNLINNGKADDIPFIAFYHETENRPENGEVARRTGSERERKQRERKQDGGKKLAASEPEAQPEKADSDSSKEGERDQSKIEGEEMLMEVSNEKPEATNKLDERKDPEDCLTAGSGEDPSSREQTDDQQPKDELPGVAAAVNEVSEEHPDVSDMLRYSMDSPGGACVAALSLMSLGLLSVYLSIPKQMVVVDSNMVDNEVVKSMAAALEEEDDEDDDGDDCEGKKRLEVKSHQASHTNYLIMRGYCFPGIVKIRNLNTTDNIVVESCIMRLQLRNTPAHNLFSKEISDSPPLDLTKCGPSLLPSILTYSTRFSSSSPNSVKECERRLIELRGYTPQDIEACAQLRSSLNAAGERGLEIRNLYKTHLHLEEPQSGRTRSLQQYMNELQEEGQVLKVGGLGIRWVLMQHADPWLLTVNSKQWSQSRFTSDRLPFLEKPHNIPFMRKGRRGRQDSEEPPAKKMAVDGQKGEDRRDTEGLSSDVTKEKSNEEEHLEKQKEWADDGSGDTLLNMGKGGGKQVQPEEEGGKQVQPEEEGGKQVQPEEEGGKQVQPEEEGGKQVQPEEEGGKQVQPEEEGGKQVQPEEEAGKKVQPEEEAGKQVQPEEEAGKKVQPEEEAGKQMLPKEDREQEAGKEKVEAEIRQEKRDRRVRANRRAGEREGEACCPPTTPASVDNSETVSFISRPWRMVDGNLNRQVCKGMLEAILYNIMFRPGLTQQSLVEHYKDVLQPMVVLDLVQALIDIGCVTKKTLVKAPKPSLFSRSAPQRSSETKVKIEEPDAVFYEPTISCCLRLSQMLPNERHWNNCLP